MIDLTKIIEGIEELAYNILIWVLLIPKTLAKIVFHPTWAPGYVAEQLKDDTEKRFDDYLSPVILIILSTLLPFIYVYITPFPNVTVTGPAQVVVNTDTVFTATPKFISQTGQFTYAWAVGDTAPATCQPDQTDNTFTTQWSSTGWQSVSVLACNEQGESYDNTYDVYVVAAGQAASSAQAVPSSSVPSVIKPTLNWRDALEGAPGILAALGFLSIPMLFSLVIEAFRGNPLTRTSLMRSFYTQCYYLSPAALAIWSCFIGDVYLVTPDEWALFFLTPLVAIIMIIWLVRNEMLLIAAERRLHRMSAFWIVLGCLMVVLIIGVTAAVLTTSAEALRQFLGWIYIAFIAFLFLIWIRRAFFRKRPQPDTSKAE